MVVTLKKDTEKIICKNVFKNALPDKEKFNRLFVELINLRKDIKNIKKV